MPWSLKRFQATGQLHFVTFSCYRRRPLLDEAARALFETVLEEVRQRVEVVLLGYVVMPEHVHLLIGESARHSLAVAIQLLKQSVSRRARLATGLTGEAFWERRYFDFNVRTQKKVVEKLRYLHRNPVERGLVIRPEDWAWSSYRHYAQSEAERVGIESEWANPWRPCTTNAGAE